MSLNPCEDTKELWEGVDLRDANMFEFRIIASAPAGSEVVSHIADLSILPRVGFDASDLQRELIGAYAPQFPEVIQSQALEVSATQPHICWYGNVSLDVGQTDPQATIQRITSAGDLASYAHPFGTSGGELSLPEQDVRTENVARELLANKALGSNLIEVGYRLRGGCDLGHHLALWDFLSAQGVYLTGVGANDNHHGSGWDSAPNNFVTWAWARLNDPESAWSALGTGRAFFGDPARFRGQLDIQSSTGALMGQVTTALDDQEEIQVLATGLGNSNRVELACYQMSEITPTVDTAGIIRMRVTGVEAGWQKLTVDTRTDAFLRLSVFENEELIAISNPLWILKEGDAGVPSGRRH